ncbi:RNA polymerase II-associated protein 1 isoform X1 [Diabrotica virgifera virgifera]|uniref:RNA polymerase II-associated protein 1 isoform X1 n=1 Tax=Diabrotica virgifera virgifera TaxID=50390 RepID=A0A6P7GEJ6_DIAVI|nr:RNA polymerase II-associated protein 1 isoform X1 [Diabrotica virgifera virgifera]
MYARPKPGETEEDLLKLQEEFERNKAENKIQLAATVVSNKKSEDKSLVESSKAEVSEIDIKEQLANTFEAIPNDTQLKNVVEHKNQPSPSIFKFNRDRGFPQAKRREETAVAGRGSIFKQQMKKQKKEETAMEVDNTPITVSNLVIKERNEISARSSCNENRHKPENLPTQSYLLTGKDSGQIHEENLNLLKNMSEEEIVEEREKLLSMMDPAIVQYLKSRRKQVPVETRNLPISEQNKAADDFNFEEIETTSEILNQPAAEKWLNFDIIETNKLAWMKNIDIPKLKAEKFEARFDSGGWILPYSQSEITEKDRILYHHGEEPGRPGYTLQELIQLSRSSVIQQQIFALNTIANIMSLYSTGVYDEIIDLPLEQIFFSTRYSMDENTVPVLNASIKVMRNLIYSHVDETCLDSLLGFGLGFIQPILAIDSDMEDDTTVNDQQLVEKDIILCLVRTNILIRIRYIINTVRPSLETITYCLEILIRLARGSDFIVNRIIDCDNLIESIVTHCLPLVMITNTPTSGNGFPLFQAVKLIRIISSRSKTLALEMINKHKVLDSILMYLSNDLFSSDITGIRLQTECIHFWSVLVHYGLAMDYFRPLQPVLLSLLDYHFKNSNLEMKTTYIRLGHISAVLILLTNIIKQNFPLILPFMPIINRCVPKWTTQLCNLTEYTCGKLQLIASLICCMTALRQYQQIDEFDNRILQILNSQGFRMVTDKIQSGSMLLNNYDTHKPSNNLRTLEVASWHTMDHVVPLIQSNSCIPFLHAVSMYVNCTDNQKVKISFLTHPNIQKYLVSLSKLDKYYLTNHWFARPESIFLMNILKSAVAIKDDIDTSIFYKVAVKCLCVFNSEQKPEIRFILANIIFCSKFYPSEVLMENLDISQRSLSLEVSLKNLNEILKVYTQILGLQNNVPDFSTSCSLDINIGNVIPIDWIYTPILVLYTNQQQNNNKTDENEQVFIIRNCLRWILIYETYFPFLASRINPTDKFCRLACVFLGSDSLFLIKEIHDLLELCFKNVMKREKDFIFNKKIQGLSNFQDFYAQLLEQYQGVSYGDILFGNIIIVPLAQKHSIEYRKTLWSEYMGVVQVCNVTPDQYIGDIQLFLDPPEIQESLLKCYRRAIIGKMARPHSILYKIANHHVETFIKSRK